MNARKLWLKGSFTGLEVAGGRGTASECCSARKDGSARSSVTRRFEIIGRHERGGRRLTRLPCHRPFSERVHDHSTRSPPTCQVRGGFIGICLISLTVNST